MAAPSPPPSRTVANEVALIGFRTYTDGSFERLDQDVSVPPSLGGDVSSKDVAISSTATARLYLPSHRPAKLPVLLYFHGGGFCVWSPSSPHYHAYINSLASAAGVLAVSVKYRRVPEHPLDACYEDSHEALRWVASHRGGGGAEAWINEHADLERVFLMGDSAGANIIHHVAMRAGGLGVAGAVLVHPYFWGKERLEMDEETDPESLGTLDAFWGVICPDSELGNGDPRLDVVSAGRLERLACRRVLVCVAEKDALRSRGWEYREALAGSGWGGEIKIWEAPGEGHVFHLFDPSSPNAARMMEVVASFINVA